MGTAVPELLNADATITYWCILTGQWAVDVVGVLNWESSSGSYPNTHHALSGDQISKSLSLP